MKYLIFFTIIGCFVTCGFFAVWIGKDSEPAIARFLVGAFTFPLIIGSIGVLLIFALSVMLAFSEEMAKKLARRRNVGKDLIASMTDLRDKMKRGDLIPTVRVERCCGDPFCSRCHGRGFIRSDGYLNDWQSDEA